MSLTTIKSLAKLPIEEEKQLIYNKFNPSRESYPDKKTLTELFEEQVTPYFEDQISPNLTVAYVGKK